MSEIWTASTGGQITPDVRGPPAYFTRITHTTLMFTGRTRPA